MGLQIKLGLMWMYGKNTLRWRITWFDRRLDRTCVSETRDFICTQGFSLNYPMNFEY